MKWTLWATEKQRANPKPMVRCTSSASVVDTDIEEALTPIFVFFFIVVIRLWWFRKMEELYFFLVKYKMGWNVGPGTTGR